MDERRAIHGAAAPMMKLIAALAVILCHASSASMSAQTVSNASTEKISDLPMRLSTDGAPPGFDPSVGDITYYAPWGNLAIFYRDFEYSSGLVSLGTLASDADSFASSGSMQVTFEPAPR